MLEQQQPHPGPSQTNPQRPCIGVLQDNAPESADGRRSENNVGPAVRFKSTVQEIDPQHTLSDSPLSPVDHVGQITPDDIKALSHSLQGTSLQERRMKNYSFEPFSLPASRVCYSLAALY
jgi:hypothetical protein